MQKLLIIAIVLLNCYQQVKCNSFLDFINKKMGAIKSSVIDAYSMLKSRLAETINNSRYYSKPVIFNSTKNQKMNFTASVPQTLFQSVGLDSDQIFSRTSHVLTTPQLAATHGRIVETHVVYTLDGYILTLHRVQPNIFKNTTEKHPRRTVLLHHGLLGSSADWIQLGPRKSLPYILADAGHDVWLANARGNYYSRAHQLMDISTDHYWNFSWQEMGEHDLPAIFTYIRKTKNSTAPVDCIGHSMGATAFLVLFAVTPAYNNYCRIAFLLAPLAFMSHTQGPLRLLATMNKKNRTALLGTNEFLPTGQTPLSLTAKMCNDQEVYCRNPLFFLTGGPLQDGTLNKEFTKQLTEYVPAGGSVNTILHYLELINNKQFHKFGMPDWRFKLKYISTPILIISSNEDYISNATDNQMLYLSILNPVDHIVIKDQMFSHTEFAWGFDANTLVYNKIRDLVHQSKIWNTLIRKYVHEGSTKI